MAIIYEGASEEYLNGLEYANFCFTGIFILEFLIKILGLGWKPYFAENWNKFDFFVVLCSVGDIIITAVMGDSIKIMRIAP